MDVVLVLEVLSTKYLVLEDWDLSSCENYLAVIRIDYKFSITSNKRRYNVNVNIFLMLFFFFVIEGTERLMHSFTTNLITGENILK